MHSEHKKLLSEIKKNRTKGTYHSSNDSYIRSGHRYYNVSVPERRRIAKAWLKEHNAISDQEFITVLTSLYEGASHEEKTVASYLLSYHTSFRKRMSPKLINDWLDHLVGWAEVDALCQNVFTAEELLSRWSEWKRLLEALAKDKNINKRRASIVLLTGPTHRSPDKRLSTLAFLLITRLAPEKEIIITKAISWLLREMIAMHRTDVAEFLKIHQEQLPKVAVRETGRNLITGRK